MYILAGVWRSRQESSTQVQPASGCGIQSAAIFYSPIAPLCTLISTARACYLYCVVDILKNIPRISFVIPDPSNLRR